MNASPAFATPERPEVSQVRRREPREMLFPSAAGRRHRMNGFDAEFTDIVDYIYRITHRIWVDRAIGRIYDYYDHGCTIYSPYGVTRSVEDVIVSTAAMINAFPDRESHFLNVAWSGDDEQGFYTSHLGFSRMTNRGPTLYGPATGRPVLIRTAADCISLNNKIHTEWLVRDNGALVRQLGFDRHEVALKLAARATAETAQVSPTPRTQGEPVLQPLTLTKGTADEFVTHVLHEVWNRRRLDVLAQVYAPEAVVHSGGGRIAVGVRNISALIISILTSIPDAVIRVEHLCWSQERDGLIVAARWTLEGTTRSGGLLGDAPANQPIAMMGISHFRFLSGKIVEEWTLFDEVAVLAQAYRGAGGQR